MKNRFFPWRLFWKFFFSILLLLNVMCVATMGAASFVFDFGFWTIPNLIFELGFFLVSIVASVLFAYRFSVPLRRVILKAIRMSNKQLFFQLSGRDAQRTPFEGIRMDEDSLFESEPGEYFELEQALDQIRRKMKKRREQLAHEREESQALLSSIEDGVVNIAPDGQLLYFNAGFATHFLSQEQLQNQSALTLTQALRDLEVLGSIDRALQEGAGNHMIRSMVTLLGMRHFSITISPLRDPKTKEIYGALGLFHDVTELKRAERIRMEFVENASHELRTPLTSVKGYLETFKEDFYAKKYEQASLFLNTISKNVDRLIDLVNDLLTISALEHGANLELVDVDVDQMTADVIERYMPTAKNKQLMISFKCVDVTSLKSDPRRLEQVVDNLLGNAIKYGSSGGKVEIVWENMQQDKKIALRVKDYGPGIAEESQARLFERFYRVDKARSREVGGTGLGLAIVKHIVQSHGGQVGVRSSLGQGAEFFCIFPQK